MEDDCFVCRHTDHVHIQTTVEPQSSTRDDDDFEQLRSLSEATKPTAATVGPELVVFVILCPPDRYSPPHWATLCLRVEICGTLELKWLLLVHNVCNYLMSDKGLKLNKSL